MFLLKSNDNLLLNSIIDVLNQKFTIFNTNEATNSFATLSISSNESTFCIETDNYKKNIFKPLSSTKLFEEMMRIRDSVNPNLLLSMGMSSDYLIALKYNTNLIRIGSKIFN